MSRSLQRLEPMRASVVFISTQTRLTMGYVGVPHRSVTLLAFLLSICLTAIYTDIKTELLHYQKKWVSSMHFQNMYG